MSDLISRTEVEKVVDELEVYTAGRLNTQKVEISVLKLQRLVNALKNIPTAYDVEKVIEKLENQIAFYNGIANDENQDMKMRQYHKWIGLGVAYALDTVRSGGKE